jgi:hypothetical protein
VVPKATTLSPGSADPALPLPAIEKFLSFTAPIPLPYRNFSETIIHREPDKDSSELSCNIFNKIIHPYDSDAFHFFLCKHNLSTLYPFLVTNLKEGFPLGDMPALTSTVIIPNHPSTLQYPDVIKKYLTDEVAAGRMSGPFPCQQIRVLMYGDFFSSPLLVSVQIQQPGTPDKLRVCRHLSKNDKSTSSVNSHIKKEDFPTRFDTASRVADIVSSCVLLLESLLAVIPGHALR